MVKYKIILKAKLLTVKSHAIMFEKLSKITEIPLVPIRDRPFSK